eukprot:TRINITY_DN10_c0_g1_i4.p1 TRINITY_DN10_c0_g1~~TRINITY_DN10_c0_g1_i4.p1  ORF type:complete len:391 (-),score=118.12 TRINITY_DN10_c0_g1_i4:55-1227(-)
MNDSENCSICFESYEDPRILNCGHSFCFNCLRSIHNGLRVQCPICRIETRTTLASLPKNFALIQLIEEVKRKETNNDNNNNNNNNNSTNNSTKKKTEKNINKFEQICLLITIISILTLFSFFSLTFFSRFLPFLNSSSLMRCLIWSISSTLILHFSTSQQIKSKLMKNLTIFIIGSFFCLYFLPEFLIRFVWHLTFGLLLRSFIRVFWILLLNSLLSIGIFISLNIMPTLKAKLPQSRKELLQCFSSNLSSKKTINDLVILLLILIFLIGFPANQSAHNSLISTIQQQKQEQQYQEQQEQQEQQHNDYENMNSLQYYLLCDRIAILNTITFILDFCLYTFIFTEKFKYFTNNFINFLIRIALPITLCYFQLQIIRYSLNQMELFLYSSLF